MCTFKNRLEKVEHRKVDHVQKVFKKIRIERQKGEKAKVNTLIPRLVISGYFLFLHLLGTTLCSVSSSKTVSSKTQLFTVYSQMFVFTF